MEKKLGQITGVAMTDRFLVWAVYGIPMIVTFLYFSCAIAHALKKNWGMAIMWTSYATANIGLLLAMKSKEI